jgi:CubicO group peptidase (beta-lactamase class C family)
MGTMGVGMKRMEIQMNAHEDKMMKMHEAKTDCRPEEVGYNPKTIETLDDYSRDLIDRGVIQSACYLLARRGRVLAHKSAGKLTTAAGSPDFLPDSLFPVMSVTKAMTAVGIWQLMERGKIHLIQPVAEILKEFDTDMHRGIGIFHLLTHTSGLPTHAGAYLEPYPEPRDETINRDNWIKKILTGPLRYKPGTVWAYCNDGFCLLAEIIARVSGMDYDRYIEENLLRPLGMSDTCFFVPDEKKALTGSVYDGQDRAIGRTRNDEIVLSQLGAGGAVSTARDLFKFGQMLLNGGAFNGARIVGRKSVEAGTRAQVQDVPHYLWQKDMFAGEQRASYGLGLEVDKHRFTSPGTFAHEGWGGTLLFMDPKEDFLFAGMFTSAEWKAESWIRPLAVAWSGIE